MSAEIKMKVESFRRIPNPIKGDDKSLPQMYEAICDVTNVSSEILQWMETNPRKQNLKGRVSKKIKESLLTGTNFHLLNRGMLISAESVSYNNYDGIMRFRLVDPEVHGDIDGGHTLRVIINSHDQMKPGMQFVKIEILTGVEDFYEDLAEARNTSTPVKDESIANLKELFSPLKDAISSKSFANRVNYMENDDGDIDVSDILSLIYMFNIDSYPEMDSCPIVAYSSKKKCVDAFIETQEKETRGDIAPRDNPYRKMLGIINDIFDLYDCLEVNIGKFYDRRVPSGKYGATTGVSGNKTTTKYLSKYSHTKINYSSPKGFLYPIIGAFRALVELDGNGLYKWSVSPFSVLDKIGPELVFSTVERSRQNGNNPNKTGKDVTFWPTLYMRVMMEKMMQQNK